MNNESNPYLRKLDQINEARKKWAESEWFLNLLCTETGLKPPTPTDEQLLQWVYKLH